MTGAGLWRFRLLFLALISAFLYLRLLPIGAAPGGLPWPDLVLCLVLAWIQRRPDHLPAILVAAVFLAGDLLLMRPPGLAFAAAEFLRGHNRGAGERPFAGEWVFVAVVIVALTLAELTVMILLVPELALPGAALARGLLSVIAYPFVVLVIRTVGVRRPGPAEMDGTLEKP